MRINNTYAYKYKEIWENLGILGLLPNFTAEFFYLETVDVIQDGGHNDRKIIIHYENVQNQNYHEERPQIKPKQNEKAKKKERTITKKIHDTVSEFKLKEKKKKKKSKLLLQTFRWLLR